MAETPLSLGEKTFIIHGVDLDLRNDGRSKYQYRPLEIETKLMKHAHGSARLRVGNITDVLVGVKVEIDTPYAERPHEGKLDFFVDCSANATPAFEGKGGDDLATEISNVLSMAYQTPNAFDLKQLCIIPYKKCWKMYVDILILQCGGNLFDAVGAAVKAALYNTEIPRVITATLDGGEPDIQVSDDPYDCIKLDVTNYPLVVTVCKIGDNFVIDPTSEEESCSTASILISAMPNGKVTSVVKLGYGSLLPSTLIKMMKVGKDISLKLNEAVMNKLKDENMLGQTKPVVETGSDDSFSDEDSPKKRNILTRRPSYRKILNDLGGGEITDGRLPPLESSSECDSNVDSEVSSHSLHYQTVIPAGTIQIATQGEGVPGLHTLTMSNAATAGGAIVQYAQGQDTQFFVPAYTGHGVVVEDAARKRELRLLKNREAARECRRKKKEYIKCLENRVAVLENRNQTLIDELKSLKELYQQKTD